MAFDWREYLSLATALRGQSGEGYSVEACDRTAVSRAYYSAFRTALNYAQTEQGFIPKRDASDHARVARHFRQMGGRWAVVADALEDLRHWRNQCDYDDQVPGLEQLVATALQYAQQRVLAECE